MKIRGEHKREQVRGGSEERRRVLRLYTIGFVCTLWMVLIGLRLWDLQVRQARNLAELAHRQQEGFIEMPAERGAIYDRRGVELALSSPVESIAAFPEKIVDRDLAVSALAQVLGRSETDIRENLEGEGFRWIKRLAEPGETSRLQAFKLAGIHFEDESKRYYPKGSVGAHLLGYVGLDQNGQGGLELVHEDLLSGRPGKKHVSYDAMRKRYDASIVDAPIPGGSLYLTIDERIQSAAERQLARAISETKARAGAVVVLDPQNGDLLASANWPTFDPNVRPRNKADLVRREHYALSRLYEPGSTFKIVTVAAALEEGLTRPEEIIDCQDGWIYVGRRRIRDHKKFGPLSVTDVLARSSNVGVIKLGQRLGAGRLREYVQRFGFGEKTGLGLPGETPGIVRPLKQWKEGSVASISMGHEVGSTPLQMARALAVIANGGYLIEPRVVDSIREPSGKLRRLEPAPRKRVISAETAAKVRAMMEQTVLTGTGRLAATPGYRSGGKTGTAQMLDPETRAYSHDLYIAGYAGFAPLNDPAMAAVIVLEAPQGDYYGGLVAAPVFPELAAQTLRFRDVAPELPVRSPSEPKPGWAAELFADLAETADAEPYPPEWNRASDGAILVSPLAALTANAAEDGDESELRRSARPANLRVANTLTPDFAGLNMREAVAEGMALGLRLDTQGDGVVLSQDPAAGTPLADGARVQLRFGRLTAQVRPPR